MDIILTVSAFVSVGSLIVAFVVALRFNPSLKRVQRSLRASNLAARELSDAIERTEEALRQIGGKAAAPEVLRIATTGGYQIQVMMMGSKRSVSMSHLLADEPEARRLWFETARLGALTVADTTFVRERADLYEELCLVADSSAEDAAEWRSPEHNPSKRRHPNDFSWGPSLASAGFH